MLISLLSLGLLPVFAGLCGASGAQAPAKSTFHVNGKSLPGISKVLGDVGDSWAGLISVKAGNWSHEEKIWFWLFPPNVTSSAGQSSGKNGKSIDNDLTIWFSGGPGCAGSNVALQEIGPFIMPENHLGKTIIKWNPLSWTRTGWLMVVDQPAGVGLSFSPDPAPEYRTNEHDVSEQFGGFLKNFFTVFPEMEKKDLHLHGNSYGAQYIYYLADWMFNNTQWNLKATAVGDGRFTSEIWARDIPAYDYTVLRQQTLGVDNTYLAQIRKIAQEQGVIDFAKKNLKYPPSGLILPPPTYNWKNGTGIQGMTIDEATEKNDCFDVYDIKAKCPSLYDPMYAKGGFIEETEGFKAAVHSNPDHRWHECSKFEVAFLGGKDKSPETFPSGVFSRVGEKSQRTVLYHGWDDLQIILTGVQLGLQNITWHGKQGFQAPPTAKLVVDGKAIGAHQTERSLTFAAVNGSGHFMSAMSQQPKAAFMFQQLLLGHISEKDLGV